MTEEAFWSEAASLLSPIETKVIFDIGAHTGHVTGKFLGLFPAAALYCFEPDPKTFQQLANRFADEPRVCAVNTAVSSSNGPADFFQNTDPHASSLFQRNGTGRRYYRKDLVMKGTTRTSCVTLDQFADERNITHIDLLKMDAQGAEYDILKGASEILTKQAIDVVATEFFCIPHYENAPLLDSIWSLLRAFAYDIYTLDICKRARNGQARWGDAIFISRRHRERVLDASPEEE